MHLYVIATVLRLSVNGVLFYQVTKKVELFLWSLDNISSYCVIDILGS